MPILFPNPMPARYTYICQTAYLSMDSQRAAFKRPRNFTHMFRHQLPLYKHSTNTVLVATLRVMRTKYWAKRLVTQTTASISCQLQDLL